MSPALTYSPSRILIIGAGLGGLALAQGLKKVHIPFHIFERDPASDFRAQGYRLKINHAGAEALKTVLSPDLWDYFEHSCAESISGETNINALDGGIIASRRGPGGPMGSVPYLADRTVLRKILLMGLGDYVSFGKQLTHYEVIEEGVIAHFADGTTEQGALLVGADGVRSSVRKQYLPQHKPVDTNGSCIYGKTPLTAPLMKTFPQRAARRMTLILDKTPMMQVLDIDETPLTLLLEPVRFRQNELRDKLPEDYIYWVLISRPNVFGATSKELLSLNGEQSAHLTLKLTEEWHPSIRSLFELQDITQSSALRIASAKPNIPVWEPSARVTLLGDAVHVMSPCGGVGAVTALRDAATLSSFLASEGISAQSVGQYEKIMRTYAGESIVRSYLGGKKMFGQRWFDECELMEL